MKKFILLSFGFLGWMFYELSGGSEFDATEIRAERLAAVEAAKPAVKEPSVTAPQNDAPAVLIDEAPKVVVDTSPPTETDVTRMSVNLTTMDSPAVPRPDRTAPAAVPQNRTVVTSSADTPAIIPSLINPNDGITQSSGTAGVEGVEGEDIRTVAGNSVNVRNGPGTDFGVVTRLRRGDAVIILQDDGNGWVRLEPVGGGPGGWMADFLLENG